MSGSECALERIPRIRDVEMMLRVVSSLGADVKWDNRHTVRIQSTVINNTVAPEHLVREMRASIQIAGPLLARCGRVRITTPGGCAIGPRPINFHLKGLAALGAKVTEEHGIITLEADGLQGAEILLDYPSVGATENLMCAAAVARGRTVIRNVAKEPEIVEVETFLNAMGAHVRGAGTDVIRVDGVDELHGTRHSIIPDRIETGTLMVAAAITKSQLELRDVIAEHVEAVIAKLQEMGVRFEKLDSAIRVDGSGPLKAAVIRSMPYPGFPTDMQPQMTALACLADGVSIIHEEVFSNRFKHVEELTRMGADIKLEGRCAIVCGVPELCGAVVRAHDLRAGAAMVLAALAAVGTSQIENAEHLARGYEDFASKLRSIGADIEELVTV
jgi:UDP-N-acetylglucosamine 1-carboxyvinyltransferase